MPAFGGLQVEIHTLGVGSAACPEYESADCARKNAGRSMRRLISLPTDTQFAICLVVDNSTFQWRAANALKLRIDFDNGDEVNEVEVFLARSSGARVTSLQSLSMSSTGDESFQLTRFARPITITIEELVSFQTVLMQPPSGGRRLALGHEGTINIAVDRCRVEASQIPRTSAMPRGDSNQLEQASAGALLEAGIRSQVQLYKRIRGPRTPLKFRPRSVDDGLAGVFIFHYRVPEEYDRLKSHDQSNYRIQDAGEGTRRIIDRVPEPEDATDPDDEQPRRATSLCRNTYRRPPRLDTPKDIEGDTIVVAVEGQQQVVEDENRPDGMESANEADSDLADDDLDMNDLDEDIEEEYARLLEPTNAAELEAILEIEDVVVADYHETHERIQDELEEIFKMADEKRHAIFNRTAQLRKKVEARVAMNAKLEAEQEAVRAKITEDLIAAEESENRLRELDEELKAETENAARRVEAVEAALREAERILKKAKARNLH